MTRGIRLFAEPLRSLAAGAIAAGYTAIGGPMANSISNIFVLNQTDELVVFSLDGVNDHFVLPTAGFLLLDISSNATTDSDLKLSKGTTIYVKQIGVPTVGNVYVSAFYGGAFAQ